MFISMLLVDVGDNPDHPRPGRLWLRNIYHVHQRLCMAFPSAIRKSNDKDFLNPYNPDDFETGHVHVNRGENAGFLFRIDPQSGGRVMILVQSAIKPDWDYAFHNADFLLAAPPEAKRYEPGFTKDQTLRFRLLANPTRRLSRKSCNSKGEPISEKWIGKRVPVPADKLYEWLARRAESGGFSVVMESTAIQSAYIYFNKPDKHQGDESDEKRNGNGTRMLSVRYDGILKVADPARFTETLLQGIGTGKAFGFGLLSVAPVSGVNHNA